MATRGRERGSGAGSGAGTPNRRARQGAVCAPGDGAGVWAALTQATAAQVVPGGRALRTAADLLPDIRSLLSPRAARGATIELLWSGAHLALYPFGVLTDRHQTYDRYRLGDLAPHQRGLVLGDLEAAGTPILLVHGMVDNRMIFTVLRRRLRRRGFGRVFTINYSPITNDIRSAARDLSGAVEELVARTGYERIHVVGHSLGGLIARYYVQCLGGDERVHTLVTLGSPHSGSLLAWGLPVRLGRQLRPGSELLAELSGPVSRCRTRFVAYYSDLDQVVVPHTFGRLDHPDLPARNVLVRSVGHMSLPIHRSVVREIGDMLSQLDNRGGMLTAGVTRLSETG